MSVSPEARRLCAPEWQSNGNGFCINQSDTRVFNERVWRSIGREIHRSHPSAPSHFRADKLGMKKYSPPRSTLNVSIP